MIKSVANLRGEVIFGMSTISMSCYLVMYDVSLLLIFIEVQDFHNMLIDYIIDATGH
jgi:hypothetical protein